MIELRVAESPEELETWARVKSEVVPDEPVTAEQLVRHDEPDRVLLLASLNGAVAGCGIGARSNFGRRVFIAARVLPQYRRRGVGRTLVSALADHGRALGLDGVNAFVDAADQGSIAFARGYGLEEVDYQLEQVRTVGEEPPPEPSPGIELRVVGDRRDELLYATWPIAEAGYADMPLPQAAHYRLDQWLREEATRPDGSFVAYEGDEIVGYAGLLEHANGPATAEHGLTVVRRDRRRHGIGYALKRAQLHWAGQNGLHELVTWTQRGNEAMQTLNRKLRYVDRSRVLTFQGPLP